MKLRITIDSTPYDVEVEVLDAPSALNGSAASRVEGLPVRPGLKPFQPASPAPRANGKRAAAPPVPVPAPSAAAPQTPPQPPAPRQPIKPWHDLTVGSQGEITAPVAGTVVQLIAKVGDAVRPGDPLLELEIENFFAAKSGPVRGTVRATDAGVIADIPVRPGDPVKFGQPLVRVRSEAAAESGPPAEAAPAAPAVSSP